jgi:hypothetical protein
MMPRINGWQPRITAPIAVSMVVGIGALVVQAILLPTRDGEFLWPLMVVFMLAWLAGAGLVLAQWVGRGRSD